MKQIEPKLGLLFIMPVATCGVPEVTIANVKWVPQSVTAASYMCTDGYEFPDGSQEKIMTCTLEGWQPLITEGCTGKG